MKTYRSWPRVRAVEAAEAYTRTVLVNTALSWFRRKSWGAERPTDQLPEPAAYADEAGWLLDEIRRLPDRQRTPAVPVLVCPRRRARELARVAHAKKHVKRCYTDCRTSVEVRQSV